jgi:AcrR family transcriptional regulator
MADTRARLIDAAMETIRTQGISGVSARSIATTAGVNQALVFYHFGTVHELLGEACRVTTAAHVARYRDRLAGVGGLRELLALANDLFESERGDTNVTVLAQMLAGSQGDPRLAEATAAALALWIAEVEAIVARLVAGTPFEDLAEPRGLARTVATAFIGIELYATVDPAGARLALAALDRLAILAEVVDDLGPIARRAVAAKLKKAAQR